MDNDAEAFKISQILSSGNWKPLTLLNWKNPQWEILSSENGQGVSSGNSNSNRVDTASLDLDSVDLIIMDEKLQENLHLKTFVDQLNNINSTNSIPLILITSDCNAERIDLKENEICLSRPFKPRELLLTAESAFYKKTWKWR